MSIDSKEILTEGETILKRLSSLMAESLRLVKKNRQIIGRSARLRSKVAHQRQERSHG
jgi:hypothetical protein